MAPHDLRGTGPQRISNSKISRIVLFLLFVIVATATVSAGLYLARYAPRNEDAMAITGRRRPMMRRGIGAERRQRNPADVNTPMGSLQKSLQAIRQHQKDMEEILPDQDPKRNKGEPDPSEELFKGGKSLGDYTKMLIDSVKSLSSFSKEISP